MGRAITIPALTLLLLTSTAPAQTEPPDLTCGEILETSEVNQEVTFSYVAYGFMQAVWWFRLHEDDKDALIRNIPGRTRVGDLALRMRLFCREHPEWKLVIAAIAGVLELAGVDAEVVAQQAQSQEP